MHIDIILLTALIAALAVMLIAGVVTRRRQARWDEAGRQLWAQLGEGNYEGAMVRLEHLRADGAPAHRIIPLQNAVQKMASRQATLEQTRRELEDVLVSLQDAVLMVDGESRLRFANRAALEMFDLQIEQALGAQLIEILPSFGISALIGETLRGGKSTFTEMTLYLPVATDVLLRVWPMRSPVGGAPWPGAVAIIQDLTGPRHLEKVRREFVANASHELRTPIANIRAMVETLSVDPDDREMVQRFYPRLLAEGERLSRLVSDLLHLAKAESNVRPEPEPVALDKIINTVLNRLRDKAQKRHVEIDTSDVAPVTVSGDASALEQVVFNLLENALVYTPEQGKVLLSLREDTDEAVFAVADTGIGIPEEDQSRVFERFYRVDKARSRAEGGTGLGLAIVKHIVENHRGSIAVNSQAGQGAMFTVRLPQGKSAIDAK